MEYVDRVCAAIDVQGFQIGKTFHARELSFITENTECCIELQPDVDTTRSYNYRCVKFQSYQIHGLGLKTVDSLAPPSSNIESVIYSLYQSHHTNSHQYLACKNTQVGDILTKLRIPFVDLRGYDIVCKRDILCLNHTEVSIHPRSLTCAYRKARAIWDYVEQNKYTALYNH